MTRTLRLLALLLPASALFAQAGRAPQSEDFGTVSGHVTCSDTQHPARLAEVRLVPVAVSTPLDTKSNNAQEYGGVGSNVLPVETDMSGAFTLRNVRPGQYYVRVDYMGYLTPLLTFTRAQLAKPGEAERQRMEGELQIVTVAPHATTQAEVTLNRGASISGTVTYDDGSPAIGISIILLRPDAKGEFKDQYHDSQYTPPTDDHGHFRYDSLPPGDYVVEAKLAMSEHSVSSMPNPAGGGDIQLTMSNVVFNLPVYSGSALRRRDATQVQTSAGHETTNIDLTIPLNKLHSVSGSLLAKDGHTINGGSVHLLHSDDREELANVGLDREDRQFHFPYVPEDDYILSVPNARDTTQVEVENAKGFTPRTHMEDKTVRAYGAAEQSLKVQTDMTGVLINVPDKKDAVASGSN